MVFLLIVCLLKRVSTPLDADLTAPNFKTTLASTLAFMITELFFSLFQILEPVLDKCSFIHVVFWKKSYPYTSHCDKCYNRFEGRGTYTYPWKILVPSGLYVPRVCLYTFSFVTMGIHNTFVWCVERVIWSWRVRTTWALARVVKWFHHRPHICCSKGSFWTPSNCAQGWYTYRPLSNSSYNNAISASIVDPATLLQTSML